MTRFQGWMTIGVLWLILGNIIDSTSMSLVCFITAAVSFFGPVFDR